MATKLGLVVAALLVACGSESGSGTENGSAGHVGDLGGSGGSVTGGFGGGVGG